MKRLSRVFAILLLMCLLSPVLVLSSESNSLNLEAYSDNDLLALYEKLQAAMHARGVFPHVEIRRNDNSPGVIGVQKRLVDLGYLVGSISGTFDSKTLQAWQNYEKASGWKTDGVATIDELQLLFSDKAIAKPTPTPKPTRRPTATPRPTRTPKPTPTPYIEPKYALADTGTGDYGTSYGYKWFKNQYKNTSKVSTVDGFTLAYYAEDVYGKTLKVHGFGDEIVYEIINKTIGPGRTVTIDRITAYGFEDAKRIYVAVAKIHFTDGRTVDIPERDREYWYWEY